MGNLTRRKMIRNTAAGGVAATGITTSAIAANQGDEQEQEERQDREVDDELTIVDVMPAEYHIGLVGQFAEQNEFEIGDEFQVVMHVDNVPHEDVINIGFDVYIVFRPTELVESLHYRDAAVGVEERNWEYWTSRIDTSGWESGDYKAIVTFTDLIRETSDTDTARFQITE